MIRSKIEIIVKRSMFMIVSLIALLFVVPVLAYADPAPADACTTGGVDQKSCSFNSANCSTDTAHVQNCTDPAVGNTSCTDTDPTKTSCGLLTQYVQPFINFLSALVGVAVTISIVIGGIQYGSSAGDSAKVSAAKNRIRNSIIALLAFIFLYTLLNFAIPGGLI